MTYPASWEAHNKCLNDVHLYACMLSCSCFLLSLMAVSVTFYCRLTGINKMLLHLIDAIKFIPSIGSMCDLSLNSWFSGFSVSQGKVCTLNRWGGKLNHLLMAYLFSTICTKNYCNPSTTVKFVIGGWVVYFSRHSVHKHLVFLHAVALNFYLQIESIS